MEENKFNDEKVFKTVTCIILLILSICAILPIILVFSASITDESTLLTEGYSFIPGKISFSAYTYLINQSSLILRAYGVTIFVTAVGTILGVFLTAMLAYPMSRKDFKYSNVIAFLVFFTMIFNGGIVPSYMMWSNVFHIKNTIFALILPNYLITGFNVFLVKNYYSNSIPYSIIEAAKIDGASEITIFYRIILPLSKPVIATVSLFTGLIYWNDWVNGLYYITDAELYPIQNLLMKIMDNVEFLRSGSANLIGVGDMNIPGTSVRMAMAVIVILPIMIVFPFIQKHFIKGVVVGSVKG